MFKAKKVLDICSALLLAAGIVFVLISGKPLSALESKLFLGAILLCLEASVCITVYICKKLSKHIWFHVVQLLLLIFISVWILMQ